MNWRPTFINRRKLQQLQMILPLDKTRYLRKSRIVAQERVRFREGVYFGTHDVHLGAYSGMRSGHLAMVSSIGRYCSIAGEAMIGQDPLDHPTHWLSTHYFQFGEHVDNGISYQSDWQDARIGNDVWIGRGALIMKGLTIGDGAIVGARSVVTKDVPPYAIVVGAPAKVIKYRFPEDVCARLLELQWWRWSPAQLADVPFDRIEAAIDCLQGKVEQNLAPYQPRELTLHRVRGGLKVEILQQQGEWFDRTEPV